MVSIDVNGTTYSVPSSAADVNWAAAQVAFEQALATNINTAVTQSAPSYQGGSLFNIASGGDVIPSTTRTVFLVSYSDVVMSGGIQPGAYVGQRLLLVNSVASVGTVTILGGTGVYLINSPVVLALGQGKGSVDLVWDGSQWYSAGFPVQPPTSSAAVGDGGTLPSPTTDTVYVSGVGGIEIQLGSAGVNAAVDPGYEGQTFTLMNDPVVSTMNVIIKDSGTQAGSNLRLSSATVTLTPGSSVTLKYVATPGVWYQVASCILV
jgi:hypothetical protein